MSQELKDEVKGVLLKYLPTLPYVTIDLITADLTAAVDRVKPPPAFKVANPIDFAQERRRMYREAGVVPFVETDQNERKLVIHIVDALNRKHHCVFHPSDRQLELAAEAARKMIKNGLRIGPWMPNNIAHGRVRMYLDYPGFSDLAAIVEEIVSAPVVPAA